MFPDRRRLGLAGCVSIHIMTIARCAKPVDILLRFLFALWVHARRLENLCGCECIEMVCSKSAAPHSAILVGPLLRLWTPGVIKVDVPFDRYGPFGVARMVLVPWFLLIVIDLVNIPDFRSYRSHEVFSFSREEV